MCMTERTQWSDAVLHLGNLILWFRANRYGVFAFIHHRIEFLRIFNELDDKIFYMREVAMTQILLMIMFESDIATFHM